MNKFKLIMLILLAIILLVPLARSNEIVQTIRASSDMVTHVAVITGQSHTIAYFGQIVLKYLLWPFAHASYLNTVYLWFNFAMLLGVVATLFFVMKLVDKNAGYFVIIILFVSTGILSLFKYGVIFDIINVYIILPLAMFCMVKWLNGSKYYFIPGICLLALYSMFHYTSLYLPYAVGIVFLGFLIYPIIKKQYKRIPSMAIISVGIIVLNLVLANIFIKGGTELTQVAVSSITNNAPIMTSPPTSTTALPPVSTTVPVVTPSQPVTTSSGFDIATIQLLYKHLTAFGVLLFVIAVACLIWLRKKVQVHTYIYLMSGLAVVLLGGLLFRVTSDYNRVALDLASTLSIITACILGLVWSRIPLQVKSAVLLIVAIGAIPNIITWVS